MSSRTHKLVTHTATAAALAMMTVLYSPSASAQKAGPTDKKAMQVLQGMSDYLAKAGTISFRARTFFDEVRKSGIKIKAARKGNILLKRPNQLYVKSVAENGAAICAQATPAHLL